MKTSALLSALALGLAAVPTRAEGPVKFTLDPAKSSLTYKVVHPFHEVEGKTSAMEGVAVVKPEGVALVQIKTDLRTFDSGNSNRDDHMKESTEANKLPWVTLKGLIKNFKMPSAFPADVNLPLEGEIELHGIKQNLTVPIAIHFDSATHAHAQAAFDVSLDAYKIDRPSMMMRKIDDACHLTADVDFSAAK
jgi:polyisoprenoid-binding protein YceI